MQALNVSILPTYCSYNSISDSESGQGSEVTESFLKDSSISHLINFAAFTAA